MPASDVDLTDYKYKTGEIMMQKKKLLLSVVIAAIIVGGFAGCGGIAFGKESNEIAAQKTVDEQGTISLGMVDTGSEAYVTPEMYGAVGDGITDDYQAVQAAIDSGKTVLFPADKTYYVSRPIIIDANQQHIECDAVIRSDAEYAVEIHSAVYSRLYFARIENTNGGCIHITETKGDESMAYTKLGFGVLIAETECIRIDTANGRWCNENQFECGQFRAGTYAVYADDRSNDSVDYSCIEGNAFYNAGIEGTEQGFFLGRVVNTYIINPRHAESKHLVTTAGKCSINLLLKNVATEEKIRLSEETNGTMICSEYYEQASGGRIDGSFFYSIVNGKIMNTGHSLYYNTASAGGAYDLSDTQFSECPTAINVDADTLSINLNECYGTINGINSIWICANETSQRELVVKKEGREIAKIGSEVPDYAWIRLDWIPGADIWRGTVLEEYR